MKTALREETSLTPDQFKPYRNEKGILVCRYNNLWMNAMVPPENADPLIVAQMKAHRLSEEIGDEADRSRFITLCREYTAQLLPVINDIKKREEVLLSDECNSHLLEIYKIARANHISNSLLFR